MNKDLTVYKKEREALFTYVDLNGNKDRAFETSYPVHAEHLRNIYAGSTLTLSVAVKVELFLRKSHRGTR